jgi:2-succinyl-6-hydroxy-2,4-cyclohexadiene-1-carboxylate synthase
MLHITYFGNTSLPPLIFLHGFFGSTQDFFPMIALLQESFYCIGIDLPGHGASAPLNPLNFSSVVDKLLEAILTLKLNQPSILGYSLGGRLAMLLHKKAPDSFYKMVILSAHPGLQPEELPQRILLENSWLKLLEELPLSDFLVKWYEQPLFQTLSPQALISQRSCGNKKALLDMMKTLRLSLQPSIWNHLNMTQNQWLFISGEKDTAYTSLYTKLPPLCHKVVIPGVSHALPIEEPRSIAFFVTVFLKRSITRREVDAGNLEESRNM